MAGQPDVHPRSVVAAAAVDSASCRRRASTPACSSLPFPIVAFFLLHGGGLSGFGVSWSAGLLSGLADSIGDAGRSLTQAGDATAHHRAGAEAAWECFVVLLGTVISYAGLAADAGFAIRSKRPPSRSGPTSPRPPRSFRLLLFVLNGGIRARAGARWSSASRVFAGIGLVIAVMGLDRGGLPIVDTRLWGGLLVTLVVSVTGIVASMPVGIALALGRRSTIPLIRIFSVAFIEFWRGVPLITVLFFATYMLPLVPARQFHGRRAGAGPDRHRAIRRRLSWPRSSAAACRPSRAGRARRQRAWPVLLERRRD